MSIIESDCYKWLSFKVIEYANTRLKAANII